MKEDTDPDDIPIHANVSVTSAILAQVFDAMQADPDLVEIAPALRRVVLEDQIVSEAAVRAVLLPDVP